MWGGGTPAREAALETTPGAGLSLPRPGPRAPTPNAPDPLEARKVGGQEWTGRDLLSWEVKVRKRSDTLQMCCGCTSIKHL